MYPPWFSWQWLLCSKFDHSYGVVYPPMVGHHGFLDKEYNVPSMTILITDSTPHHGVVCPVWLTLVNYWWTNVSISPPPMSRTIGKKWEKYYWKCWEKLFLKNLEPALLRCRFNIEFCTKEGGGAPNNSGWMSVKWMRKRNLPDTRQTENFVIVFGKLSRK